jgi:uncharacterized protein YyaL (SSP411 family)
MQFYKTLVIFFTTISLFTRVYAQADSDAYSKRVAAINKNIYQYFFDSTAGTFYEKVNRVTGKKQISYLWPLCGLLQAANEMDVMQPQKKYTSQVMQYLLPYYAPLHNIIAYNAAINMAGKPDRYYDDNQWIGLALIDNYQQTKSDTALNIAKDIYTYMLNGYDTISGGGLYWREGDSTTKNTCSNGPGIVLALKLYQTVKKQSYLDTALLLYNWTNAWLRTPQGLFYDNVKLPSRQIDKRIFSYNAGTMLEANVLLYNITKQQKYITEAKIIALAATKYFYDKPTASNLGWFDAVMMRGLISLYKADGNKLPLQQFMLSANTMWNKRDSKNFIGQKDEKELLQQAALMEIYARAAKLYLDRF